MGYSKTVIVTPSHGLEDLPDMAVAQMLMPLGDATLTFEKGD